MTEFEEYMKTGMLGSYRPERVTGLIESGEVMPVSGTLRFGTPKAGVNCSGKWWWANGDSLSAPSSPLVKRERLRRKCSASYKKILKIE